MFREWNCQRCRHVSMYGTPVQVLFLEVAGWKRAALTSANSTEDVCPGMLQRSDALAFGAAAGGYLVAVGCQLVVRLLLSSLRLPQLGNLEDPRFSFMYAAAAAVVATVCRNQFIGANCLADKYFLPMSSLLCRVHRESSTPSLLSCIQVSGSLGTRW